MGHYDWSRTCQHASLFSLLPEYHQALVSSLKLVVWVIHLELGVHHYSGQIHTCHTHQPVEDHSFALALSPLVHLSMPSVPWGFMPTQVCCLDYKCVFHVGITRRECRVCVDFPNMSLYADSNYIGTIIYGYGHFEGFFFSWKWVTCILPGSTIHNPARVCCNNWLKKDLNSDSVGIFEFAGICENERWRKTKGDSFI